MSMTEVKTNTFSFSEVTEKDTQPLVTNDLGRDADSLELVYLDGYFGEVKEAGGIASTEQGRINIDHERTVRTGQIEATDTFVVGQILHFLPGGSSAAGTLIDIPEAGSIPAGIILEEEGAGGAQTSVTFRPFAQGAFASIGRVLKIKEIVVPAGSHAAGTPVVDTSIPVGSIIVDATALGTAASGSGTVAISDGTNAITTTPIVMAVVDALSRAVDIDATYKVVVAAGVTLTANATGDAGIVHIYYI